MCIYMDCEAYERLKKICIGMRKDCLLMAEAAGSEGFHFGASLSMIEIAAVLYCHTMNFDINNLCAQDRDRFILSKGHGVPAVYAALHNLGAVSTDELMTFKNNETRLYGHPCMNPELGIEISTGSLGQGLSYGVGKALALLRKGNHKSHVYVVLGDGECDEGSVWEAAMSAAKYKLSNLMAIIDCNGLSYDGATKTIMPLLNLADKWKSFGWRVIEIDGHNLNECATAFAAFDENTPTVVIANTVKGKGISFMENDAIWHHGRLTKAQLELAREEVFADEH